jgi:hypothetical protein
MSDIVECISGSTYAERPIALTWQGQRFSIAGILSQGRTPQAIFFRVRIEDGRVFELSCVEAVEEISSGHIWQIQQL